MSRSRSLFGRSTWSRLLSPMCCTQRSLSGFSASVCRRLWYNVVEYRDTASSMTNPSTGWLVLRRAAEERPPQHSDQRKWVKLGVQRQAFSSKSQFGFEIRRGFGKMVASEEANGKSRLGSRFVRT